MPSDFEPISQTVCVCCGRGPDQVALGRLKGTYARAFICLTCAKKYANCGNCQHERHGEDRSVALSLRQIGGRCHCGCTEYIHGAVAEYHRQFAAHTGKAPEQRRCNHCGNWFGRKSESGNLTLFCESCEREWRGLNA